MTDSTAQAELYADMVLTGQKPIAFIPTTSKDVEAVLQLKPALLHWTSVRGIWVYRYSSMLSFVQWLDAHMDTSGSVTDDNVVDHWIAGLAFGYSVADINSWLTERR